jgi:hypothetical protein
LGLQFAYPANDIVVEHGIPYLTAARSRNHTALLHVAHIVTERTGPQMAWVNAEPVVADVRHDQPIRNEPKMEDVRHHVTTQDDSALSNRTITIANGSTPKPAFVIAVASDASPKARGERWSDCKLRPAVNTLWR